MPHHPRADIERIAIEALYRPTERGGGGGGDTTQPAFFVDPSNVTGKASDNNTGLTADVPLLTFSKIVEQWGTNSPALAQDTTITFLSSQPNLGADDPIDISPKLVGDGTSLFLIGTLVPVVSDTIAVFTPRDRDTGVADAMTGTAITDFTPYNNLLAHAETFGSATPAISPTVALPLFFSGPEVTFSGVPTLALNPIEVDIISPTTFNWSINGVVQQTGVTIAATVLLGTTGITANFPVSPNYAAGQFYQAFTSGWFWIDSTSGASATITAPMTLGLGLNYTPPFYGTPWITLANGCPFTIYTMSQINVQSVSVQNSGFVINNNVQNSLFLEQLWLTSPPSTNEEPNYFTAEAAYFQQCRIDSTQVTQGQLFAGSDNCLQNGGFFGGGTFFYGGSIGATGTINTGTIPDSRGIAFDGDILIDDFNGGGLKCNLGNVVFGFARLANHLNLKGTGGGYLSADDARLIYAANFVTEPPYAALWGPGHLVINNGNAFRVVNGSGITATGSILLTADPQILLDNSGAAIYSTYNAATGVWTPNVAPTAPNVDTFTAVINPQTGSLICLNGDADLGAP
jgi:hypothetical protein